MIIKRSTVLVIKELDSQEFKKYGRVIDDVDFSDLLDAMEQIPVTEQVVYEASVAALENCGIKDTLDKYFGGGLEIQIGYCNGDNHTLNALEYHRNSELNVAKTEFIALLGMQQDIDTKNYTYDTSKVEAFRVPAGTAVEYYATALHYAPISVGENFKVAVVLPKGTNEPLEFEPQKVGEEALLTAQNKWLIAHSESGLDKDGAHIGLIGENITV